MVDDTRKLSITYSSGLIPPPELMSTLAVFYDEIWLPYPYFIKTDGTPYFFEKPELSHVRELDDLRAMSDLAKIYTDWDNKFRLLVDKEIIRTIQGIDAIDIPIPQDLSIPDPLVLKAFNIFSKRYSSKDTDHIVMNTSMLDVILAINVLYNRYPAPEIFIPDPLDTNTSRLAGLLVNSLFQYQVPQLQVLNAEQILEIRDYLKDTKDGFRCYISEMIDDIERRIQEHNLSDIEATQKTFERKIQPQYEEFCRKLAAKKTGFWSKIAVAGGKFLQVDAAPWTPKFWGAVLEMFGVSIDELSKSEQENFLSNKSQAFNYIATLEDRVARISNRHG